MKKFTESELAEIVVQALTERDIKPDAEVVAVSGRDYGHAEAFELPGDLGYALRYAIRGETSYDMSDDVDDLACWLEFPDLSTLDTVIQTANVRGYETVSWPSDHQKGPFYVLSTKRYITGEDSDIERDDHGDPIGFATHEEAQDWIAKVESDIYVLSHNETERPVHTIIEG